MAEPKLQIEKRLDRIEIAILKMLEFGYGDKETEVIEQILRADARPEESQDAGSESQGRVQVREEGKDVPDEEASSETGSGD
jgi:hypothetical protein